MIEHVAIPVKNAKKSKEFYKLALQPLGYRLKYEWSPKAMGFMEGGHTSFIIAEDKKARPMHVAFLAKSMKAVQEFHRAALKAGAKDNGAPGFREAYGPTYYAAFMYDLDGHNVEACYFGARAPKRKK